jgi:hypothetical protein
MFIRWWFSSPGVYDVDVTELIVATAVQTGRLWLRQRYRGGLRARVDD